MEVDALNRRRPRHSTRPPYQRHCLGLIAEIDAIIFGLVPERRRKVAYIVSKAMSASDPVRTAGLPDVFYAERSRHLARIGMIESVGNLRRMRYSEVRKRPKLGQKACLH